MRMGTTQVCISDAHMQAIAFICMLAVKQFVLGTAHHTPLVVTKKGWGLQAHAGKGGSRAVYIAPKPELAQERFADWTQKFGAPGLGLNVCLLTGDPLADYGMLREANIVISTPEHWDMLSRRWRQQSRKEVRNVALFLVDELHLIGGANGPVLEVGACSKHRDNSGALHKGDCTPWYCAAMFVYT